MNLTTALQILIFPEMLWNSVLGKTECFLSLEMERFPLH